MNESNFDAFARTLSDGSLTRRTLARSLAGAPMVIGLLQVGLDELEAEKRKKRRNRARQSRRGANTR